MTQQSAGRRSPMPQRPMQSQRPADALVEQQPPQMQQQPPRYQEAPTQPQKRRLPKALLFAVIGLVLLVAIAWFVLSMLNGKDSATSIDESKYQAVLLDNGSSFYGKLEIIDDNFMRLNNVFYIQADSPSNNEDAEQVENGDMKLLKRGEEIHGPDDGMVINREKILFFENLKTDGQVSQLIEEYESNN